MTRIVLTLILILTAVMAVPGSAKADVLLIEEVRQAGRMELPINGQTKAEIEARFGSPSEKHSAVGDPPITRWQYERWSVYFEYGTVLFTVLHKGEVITE